MRLLIVKDHGTERICSADLGKLQRVANWTDKYRVFWNKKLDKLEDPLIRGQHEPKKG